jgi:hypothetical protein
MLGLSGIVLPEGLAQQIGVLPGMADIIQVGALQVDEPGKLGLRLIALFAIVLFLPDTHQWMASRGYKTTNLAGPKPFLSWQPNVRFGLALAVALFICVVKSNDVSPFIYFQF